MNGAESLVRTLVAGGVDVCFSNPGTSEMHFVAALDRVEGMRCVLGLFEGVVTGAADGYFRMKGTPASTLLHLGPGLANGLANLHNAKKAHSGIVNIVGQHATYHIGYNAPLTSDIEGLARPMSEWVRTSPDGRSRSARPGFVRGARMLRPRSTCIQSTTDRYQGPMSHDVVSPQEVGQLHRSDVGWSAHRRYGRLLCRRVRGPSAQKS